MFVSDALNINEQNHLTIGNCDTLDLVKQYGTPLYVLDETQVRKNCRVYKKAIDKCYNGNGLIFYASKALCNLELVRIIKDEGLGIDVVSGGELYTALKGGIEPDKICVHGNNKTIDELEYAIKSNVGRIVVDNENELELIDKIAMDNGLKQKVLFRIKPGIDAHTHDFIMTGQIDSKFGVSLENGEAHAIIKKALTMKNIIVGGIHCHIGSQIFETAPFIEASKLLINLISDIKNECGFEIKELNLGGGFGVKYTDEDHPMDVYKCIEDVSNSIKETAHEKNINIPFIMMEPGRSIVAEAGITLYKVGAIKDIPNIRRYISVDGGMTDNPRYALYQAKYSMIIANKAANKADQIVTVAGKCCESGDVIGKDIPLSKVEVGDILAVFTTGAYNYSMSSNYNRIPRPAMVMTKDKTSRIIVKRETYEDIIRNDI